MIKIFDPSKSKLLIARGEVVLVIRLLDSDRWECLSFDNWRFGLIAEEEFTFNLSIFMCAWDDRDCLLALTLSSRSLSISRRRISRVCFRGVE